MLIETVLAMVLVFIAKVLKELETVKKCKSTSTIFTYWPLQGLVCRKLLFNLIDVKSGPQSQSVMFNTDISSSDFQVIFQGIS